MSATFNDTNGLATMRISVSRLAEQQTQDDVASGKLTFASDIKSISIQNTDTNDGVFTVNGIAINVPKGGSFQTAIGGTPGKTVTITGSTTYIVSAYE